MLTEGEGSMKRVLFITNIPAPYRIEFYNQLGKYVDLTVIFEAKRATKQGIRFDWIEEKKYSFRAIFLSDGDMDEKKIDKRIFKYVNRSYDIVVVTSYAYYTEMAALIYLKMKRIPYYMEVDGGVIRNENFVKRLYKKFLVSGAKGYLSPSVETDKYLQYYGAKEKIIYRYPFTSLKDEDVLEEVPTREIKERYRKELQIKEKNVVLGVGQFIYRKGYDVLLKASQNFGSDTGVYIIGNKATSEYEALVEQCKLQNIYFVEFKTKKELAKYYKCADVFVHPTREDIWGLVINEAMGYALPVITTDKCVAGLEMVKNGENGFIVPVEDVEVLAEKINYILNDEKQKRRMQEKSLNIGQKYTIENMVREHLKLFKVDADAV